MYVYYVRFTLTNLFSKNEKMKILICISDIFISNGWLMQYNNLYVAMMSEERIN